MKKFIEWFKKAMSNQLVKWFVLSLIVFSIIGICFEINDVLGYIAFSIPALGIVYLTIRGTINVIKDNKNAVMYIIKKGHHYCNRLIPGIKIVKYNYSIEKKFILTNSCLYHFDGADNHDINKLWGLTFGIDPKKNSIRFGWNCQDRKDEFCLFVFEHYDGKMYSEKVANIKPEKEFILKIKVNGNIVSMFIDDIFLGNYDVKPSWFVVVNRPYFGGQKTAPRDMIILQS